MAVGIPQEAKNNSFQFITFSCFKHLSLFDLSNQYDCVYNWFDAIRQKDVYVSGYVIMPNHLHSLLYFGKEASIQKLVSNGKRFMAKSIIEGLKIQGANPTMEFLYSSVSERERKKGQRYKVFNDSFDSKECFSEKFLFQKLSYMHENPVSKKWRLVDDFTKYPHSSASFYNGGVMGYKDIFHIEKVGRWK